ncbi:PadR family transcriptional regulator [Gemmatimonadota bacterium]
MSRITDRSLYGMVDLLVLKTLSSGGEMHGLSIIDEIRKTSGDFILIEDGALYPALHRLQKEGLLKAEWRISDKRRRAKFYTITADGRRELKKAVTAWQRHTTAVGMVLEINWGGA